MLLQHISVDQSIQVLKKQTQKVFVSIIPQKNSLFIENAPQDHEEGPNSSFFRQTFSEVRFNLITIVT